MNPRNPFIVSGYITRPYICDRYDEEKQLISSVTNGVNTVLISPRRMGKTTLINLTLDSPSIKDEYLTFFVDILQATSLREFTYLLGREIFETLAPRGQKWLSRYMSVLKSLSGQWGFDPMTGTPVFSIQLGNITQPEYTLSEIFSYLQSSPKPCIVAIDEFQQVANFPEKNTEAILRSHIQRQSNTNFIFAGSRRHMLMEIQTQARPFFRSASILELGAIPCDIYTEFACRMFESRQRTIDAGAVTAAYDTLEGNTSYLQQVMNGAFADTPEGARCTVDRVENSLCRLLDSSSTTFRETLSQLSEPQKELLYAVAIECKASRVTSGAFIRSHGLKSASSVQSALRKLTDLDLLSQTPDDKGYKLSDPLLRLWISTVYGPADGWRREFERQRSRREE